MDAEDIPNGQELTYSVHDGLTAVSYNYQALDKVRAVWYRMAREYEDLPLPVDPYYLKYSQSAILRHVNALFGHLEDALWVSNPYAIRRADYKPMQLTIAARLGFKVPDTIFTSNPEKAKAFVDDRPSTITKALATRYPVNKEKGIGSFFYAKKLYREEKNNFSGLHLAPAIFQEAIEAAADLRVTVIGKKVFAAIITVDKLDENSTIRDWRIGHHEGEMHIEPYELPNEMEDMCIALVQELGLNFGAIDLVLDKKGKLWFLENNPNGQWAFVEEATGQPMGKAMAELLEAGAS